MTFSYVFILVQLNKCVGCASVLQKGHSGDGWLCSSILFKYESRVRHLCVLSWVRGYDELLWGVFRSDVK